MKQNLRKIVFSLIFFTSLLFCFVNCRGKDKSSLLATVVEIDRLQNALCD